MNSLIFAGSLFFLPASAMQLALRSQKVFDLQQPWSKKSNITHFNQDALKEQNKQQFLHSEELHIKTMNQCFGLSYTPKKLTEFVECYIEDRLIPCGRTRSLQEMYQYMEDILANEKICTAMIEQDSIYRQLVTLLMATGNNLLEPVLTSAFFGGDPSAVSSVCQLSAAKALSRIVEHPSKPKPRSLSSAEILCLNTKQLELYEYMEQTTTIPRIERHLLSIFLSPAQEEIAKTLPSFITKKVLFRDLVFRCQFSSVMGRMHYVGKFFIKNPGCIAICVLCAPVMPIILPLMLYSVENTYTTHKSIDMITGRQEHCCT
jgi:hypothetical protein